MDDPNFVPDRLLAAAWPAGLPRPEESRRGDLFCFTTRPSLDFRYGNWSVREVLRRPLGELAAVAGVGGETPGLAWEGAAFIDLEAGRHPRGGSCIALAGIGRFDGDRLVVRQFLARDAEAEPDLVLAAVAELRTAALLVTFSGKSFDLPLLHERARANGAALALPRAHLDLYRIARRVLVRRFADTRLETHERELLRHDRDEAAAGRAGPQALLHHNLCDVLALPVLAAELSFRLESPQDGDERERIADERAARCRDRAALERALLDAPDHFKLLLELSKACERDEGGSEAALGYARRALTAARPHQADAARRRIRQLERRAGLGTAEVEPGGAGESAG